MNAVEARYIQLHQRSAELYQQAVTHLPSGVTHDARFTPPFPLYVERSSGAYKWDADENQLIDYVTGHGALLLGHGHPEVVAAVQQQMARGTHYGAEHGLALRWAALVQQIFPAVELVRFVASGTEATQMAVRVARAATGRSTVVRVLGHYHGWHDGLAYGMDGDFTHPSGLPEALRQLTVPVPARLESIEQAFREAEVAALILEPTGASYGMVPFPPGFLTEVRRLTQQYGVLLICDEVVTGFRLAQGGAQQQAGIAADLTTFAKVLAGGLPGGALGGRADLMSWLAFGDESWNRQKVRHNGTFNANPLSAAAGIVTLEHVATGEPAAYAEAQAMSLIAGLNLLFQQRGLAGWTAYGHGSIFHLVVGASVPCTPGELPTQLSAAELKRGGDPRLLGLLRMALVNQGVDLMRGRSGFLSIAHTPSDIQATLAAFEAAITALEHL